ncbi:MAG: tyrosine-type recombinase/integrase [Bacillota bacterium]
MKRVEPIKDIEIVLAMCDYLKSQNERNYIMFMMGLYTGLRIGDILKLRINDVRGVRILKIREQKTGNVREIPLDNPELSEALKDYVSDKPGRLFLVKSRVGVNKPIGRQMAYNIIKAAALKFKLKSIGTHSMRKTLAEHVYMDTGDLVVVQKILNHYSLAETIRYLGLNDQKTNGILRNLSYKNI